MTFRIEEYLLWSYPDAVINFKPKGAALKKRTSKKRTSLKVKVKGLSRKDVAEMNLFGRVIAQMNAKVR